MTDHSGFAKLPSPPYYAVIFSSQRSREDEAGYHATADRMLELVRDQPGFLRSESGRGADGLGITVAYFGSEAAIAAWRIHPEHAQARSNGHRLWYAHFEQRIAKVERAYGGVRRDAAPEASP